MLKQANDGLTKLWKPVKSNEPFNCGGKIQFLNNELIASLYEGNVVFVDNSGHNQNVSLIEESENREEIVCFCVNFLGTDIATASKNLLVRHWKIEDRTCVRSFKAHNMPVLSMCYDRTNTLIATGSADRTVKVWDIHLGYCTHVFRYHTAIVQYVEFHPDPNRLLLFSCSDDNSIKLYDLNDSSCKASFEEHMGSPTFLSFTSDGYIMASVGRDKVINFYELRTNSHIKTVAVMDELEGAVMSSASGSNSHVLTVAGRKGIFHVYKFSMMGNNKATFTCELLKQISAATGELSPVNIIKSNSTNNTYRSVSSLHYISNSNELVAVTSDYTFSFFSLDTVIKKDGIDALFELKYQLIGSSGDILDIAVIPCAVGDDNTKESLAEKIAIVSNSSNIQIMDSDNFHISTLYGHTDIVLAVDICPDGTHIVTSSKDHTCRLWNVLTNMCCGVGVGHTDSVGSICVSQRDSTYASKLAVIVTGGVDKVIKRWSIPYDKIQSLSSTKNTPPISLNCTHSVRGHDKDINTLAMSPNDAIVASGSQDSTIRIWNSNDLSSVATLSGHKKGIWRVCFSPVDRCLASCSGDRTVRLWSLNDYSCLRTFQGHTASVLAVKFINHGMQLVSSSSDGLIRLWTIRTGECENTFDKHKDKIWSLSLSKTDSNVFYSAGSDSCIIKWMDDTDQIEEDRLKSAERVLLLEQSLSNSIRNKKYNEALETALELGYSNKILGLFTRILDDFYLDNENIDENRINCFDEMIRHWDDERIIKIINYIKEWNTNSKFAYVAQIILNGLIRIVKIEKIISLFKNGSADQNTVLGLIAYGERHFQRYDKIHEALYMMEFMNTQMSLLPQKKLTDQDAENVLGKSKVPVLFAPVEKKRKVSL